MSREYSSSGIAATGASLAGSGFNLLLPKANATAFGFRNTTKYICGYEYDLWAKDSVTGAQSIKDLGSSPGGECSGTENMYQRDHSTLLSSLGVSGDLEISTPVSYIRPAVQKNTLYRIEDELIQLTTSTVASITGGMKATTSIYRGSYGTTAASHSAGVKVQEVVFAQPGIEFWTAIQGVIDHADIRYINYKDSTDENLQSNYNTLAAVGTTLLKGDLIAGKFTGIALAANNYSIDRRGALMIYSK